MLKGNAIVGQSGGPTAAINATLSGVIRGALDNEAIGTLYGAFNGLEGMLRGKICNLSEIFGDEKKLITLENTPAAALGSCRLKLPALNRKAPDETYAKLFAFFRKYDIRYFFYIGGNDSMDTVAKLTEYSKIADYEIRVMGVPKTIDNDLAGTDHTPGYGSAAKFISTTVSEVIRDCAVYTTKAVTIIEIMGRDAGWLTAAAALPRLNGDQPDLIYLPERAFVPDEFFADLEKALKKHPNVVVAVSEGIKLADGTYVCEAFHDASTDAFGHKQLSGTGKALELAVREKLGCKVRSIEINTPQRCAAHLGSLTDIRESVMIGTAAVNAACDGVSGKMACIIRDENSVKYRVFPGFRDISKIANKVRKVPLRFINKRGNNVTDACVRYLAPLINGESYPEYENGLPVHIVL